jgi:isoleucyl-tRNA synthetase
MYPQPKQLNLPEIDQQILDFWQRQNIFEKSISERANGQSFVFYEGPPSANGMPGIHHVMGRTVKDSFCRYHTMKGKQVKRKAGWDTHGLPIELKVESELGITKEDIGKKISVDEYNRQCRETVMRFKDRWDKLTVDMGYWVDLDNPYITFDNNYIESVWWLLGELYKKNLMYKGYTIQPYSPAAGTGLSSHELNLPGCYRSVKDTSAVAMFKVLHNDLSAPFFAHDNEDLRILAWTTTPWTLPSNTALAMGANIEYLKLETFNPYTAEPVSVVLAEALLGSYFKPEGENAEMRYEKTDKLLPWRKVGSWKGKAFDGLRYEQLLPYAQPEDGDAFRVIMGDFVSTEDGTGIVHIAPSFGADDMRVAKQNGIGSLTLVDKQGKFTDNMGEFAGRYVKDYMGEGDAYVNPDVDISVKLKIEGKAFNVQRYEHNYPHCWRTDKPILYYPLDSWFIKASSMRERMAELNKTINWKPEHTGTGRFQNWLENLQDWNLSRSRYWGIPLPIWRNEDGSEELCISSVAQLQEEVAKANAALGLNQTVPADLHRPYIDDVVLVSASGQAMKRELDLIDVWFDSGAMPYAQHHFPFENKDNFQAEFPADFIAEGVDQTRGWFYTLHAIATMVFDSVAFKNVVSNGLVLDKNGEKMSKRLGNVVDPFETISTYGADATRWYLMSNANPWDNLKFDLNGIDEVRRKFFGTLYNTYSFFALYANVDGFDNSTPQVPMAERPEIDRWILSLLNSLIQEVDKDLADYEPTRASRKVAEFVDEHLSNWYVRLCRRRFWKNEQGSDKLAAYQTLYECLVQLSKLMAPIAPFFADWLFKNLNDSTKLEPHESVHLAFFPSANTSLIDKALEERMAYAQRIASLVLSLRKREKIRVRQPLQKILLPILDDSFEAQVEKIKDLILTEVNVKEIAYVKDTDGLVTKSIKPDFKTLGKVLGKHMKAFQDHLAGFTQQDISQVEKSGYSFSIEGETFQLEPSHFSISSQDIEGWLVASENGLTVALDVHISPELESEGIAREIVNRIQNIRKEQDFDVTDRIVVVLQDLPQVQSALAAHHEYISNEVLANSLTLSATVPNGQSVELLDEVMFDLSVVRG